MAAETDYPVEPPFEQRFREGRARAIIEEVLNAKLGGCVARAGSRRLGGTRRRQGPRPCRRKR